MIEVLTSLPCSFGAGVSMGIAYNPILSVVGAAVAAALFVGVSPKRALAGAGTLLCFWLFGDGLRVIARARDLADGLAHAPASIDSWVLISTWGLVGLLLGYALPAWAGAFAGRRVIFGTGWLTAVAVSVGLSLTLAAFVSLAR